MSILSIAMTGVAVVVLATQIKSVKPEFTTYIIICGAVLISFYCINKIILITDTVNKIGGELKISGQYVKILAKIVGVTYICEFSSDICKDIGYQAIANQIQIFGKVSILVISIPVFINMFDMIGGML